MRLSDASPQHVAGTRLPPPPVSLRSGPVPPLRLLTDSHPDPAIDTALSSAVLQRVARGEIGPTLRLFVPGRIVAFGSQDRTRPGYRDAVAAVGNLGFDAIERLAGGRAATFHEGTIAFAWATPHQDSKTGIEELGYKGNMPNVWDGVPQEVLDKHLSESNFNVEQFSKEMGMSRMQLHRKLKALTGQTTTEFIRSQRLKLAASLLQKSDVNISEIGYQVGFNDHSYFTKCFRETYGTSPSEFSKK